MERIPLPGQFYRHFKGNLYQIITVAKHSETGEQMVVYQALYGDFGTYVRPLAMFTSEVDHEKYPEVKQKYRFEQVDFEKQSLAGESYDSKLKEEKTEDSQRVWNPWMLSFIETENLEEKLQLFSRMEDKITQEELDIIHVTLDMPETAGSISEQFQRIRQYLQMQMKYDGTRFRKRTGR